MKLDNEYPEPVKDACNEIINNLLEQNFFEKEEANEQITFDVLCKSLLYKFINGEELLFDEDELGKDLNYSIVRSIVEKLENDGIITTLDTDDGDKITFMTKQQKTEFLNKSFISSHKNNSSSK
jgi:predicted transcriptional regulator